MIKTKVENLPLQSGQLLDHFPGGVDPVIAGVSCSDLLYLHSIGHLRLPRGAAPRRLTDMPRDAEEISPQIVWSLPLLKALSHSQEGLLDEIISLFLPFIAAREEPGEICSRISEQALKVR